MRLRVISLLDVLGAILFPTCILMIWLTIGIILDERLSGVRDPDGYLKFALLYYSLFGGLAIFLVFRIDTSAKELCLTTWKMLAWGNPLGIVLAVLKWILICVAFVWLNRPPRRSVTWKA